MGNKKGLVGWTTPMAKTMLTEAKANVGKKNRKNWWKGKKVRQTASAVFSVFSPLLTRLLDYTFWK